jgi:hypothetical protein
LRTTNPIESTFATVRLRTKVTKGPGSRAAGIAMAYKLIDAAQAHWRSVNAPHSVALVRAGAVFHKGRLLERPVDITPAEPDAESTDYMTDEVPEYTADELGDHDDLLAEGRLGHVSISVPGGGPGLLGTNRTATA